jgi:hypothetical protein
MKETSIITYQDLLDEGKISQRQEEVISALEVLGTATDTEISRHLGYEDPNFIRPRRKELVDMGIIFESEKRICSQTGRLCYLWSLNTGDLKKAKKKGYLEENQLKKMYELINDCNDFQIKKLKEYLRDKYA